MDSNRVAQNLRRRREELAGELSRLIAPPEQGVGVGFGKRVGDGTTEAVERFSSTAAARSLAASIAEIDRAFVRIEDGTYGTCESCGRVIDEARLEARPAAAMCVGCARLNQN